MKILLSLCLCYVGLTAVPISESFSTGTSDLDWSSLKDLFDATNGPSWIWNSSTGSGPVWNFSCSVVGTEQQCQHPCADDSLGYSPSAWQGIICSSSPSECYSSVVNCTVTHIILDGYNLQGTLPSSISGLRDLRELSVYGNSLTGTLPSDLGLLQQLKILSMEYNLIGGSLPSSLFTISSLEYLGLWQNRLVGSIPTELGELKALKYIDFNRNQFLGTIPETISKLTELQELYVGENHLTGTIPDSLNLLSALKYMYLGVNQLRGTIPEGLSELTDLQLLYLGENQLTGTLSDRLSQLTDLQYLYLGTNQLRGTIPKGLSELSDLQYLALAGNNLVGTIPEGLGQLSDLEYFSLSENNLTGPIPDSLGELINLQRLFLAMNHFTGTVPRSFGQLSNLIRISLYNNLLISSLPSTLMSLSYLEVFQVHNNKFTGYFSDVFQNVDTSSSMLDTIDISGNAFRGTLPGSIFKLKRLTNFAATGNCFSGELSNEICDALSIKVLVLTGLSSGSQCPVGCSMHGTIPSCIFGLGSLKALYISGNGLYGSLGNLANSSMLVNLSATNNHLEGTIPIEYHYSLICKLELSFNRISGSLEDLNFYGGNDLDSTLLDLNVNRLSGGIPAFVNLVGSLDLLSGNLFDCSSRKSLPTNDPGRDQADCGSHTLDRILILSACIFGVIGFVAVAFCWYSSRSTAITHRDLWPFFQNLLSSVRLLPLKEKHNVETKYPIVHRTLLSTTGLVHTVCLVGIFIAVCSLALFVSLKIGGGYGTHMYQYSWIVTAAMVSGETSAICLCVFWVGIAAYVYWRLIIQQFSIDRMVAVLNSEYWLRKSQFRGLMSLQLSTKVQVVGVILVNILLTAIVNGLYVYLVLEHSSYVVVVFVQAFLGGFRLAWKVLLPKVLSLSAFRDISAGLRVRLMLLAGILDDIVVPVVALMCIDPSCFLSYFSPPAAETTSYGLERCTLTYPATNECVDGYTVVDNYESQYQPMFIYNYQCGTSVIKTFVPVIMFSCCISCVFSSIFIFLANFSVQWEEYVNPDSIFMLILPELLVPQPVDGKKPIQTNILEGDIFLVAIYQYLAVLLSFGICAPYVALMCVLSVVMFTIRFVSSISRFIINQETILLKDSDHASASIQRLNENCSDVVADTYDDWCVFMLFVCDIMVSLLQVDMEADEDSVSSTNHFAYLLVPLVLAMLGESIRRRFYRSLLTAQETREYSEAISSSDKIELNPLHIDSLTR